MIKKVSKHESQNVIEEELRMSENLRAALARAEKSQAAVRNLFEPGPPGSGIRWVLKTEPLPRGSFRIEED